jgi:AsmA protein
MKKIYALAGLTVLSVILALLAGIVFATGWAAKALQERAAVQLGRGLTIAGGVSVEFAPRLALRFDTVELGNGQGLEGAFATAEAVRVPLTLAELTSRRLGQNLILVNPQVSFEISDRGDVSWSLPDTAPANPGPVAFTVTGGTFRYYDHRNDQHLEMKDADLAIAVSATGEITVTGSAVMAGRSATLNLYVKSLARIAAGGSPAELSLQSPLLEASFSGRLGTGGSLNLVGTASLSGPSLRAAAQWAGLPLPGSRGLGPFTLSGEVESEARDITLRQAAMTVDSLAAQGSLGLLLGGERPQLLADIGLDRLDLATYVDAPDAGVAGWSEAPLDYGSLRAVDARLSVNLNSLSLGPFATGKATLQATLAAGRLGAIVTSGEAMGGEARIDFEADGSGGHPVFSLHVEGHKLDAMALTAAALGTGLAQGPADLSLNVSGYGPSTAAIVSTLKGSARLSLASATLLGVDVKGLLAAVTQKVLQGWQRQPQQATAVTALAAGFDIADGIATTRDLALTAGDVAVTGTGTVDLLRQAVDLSRATRIGRAALPVPVIVKGPWADPRLYPDVPDILMKPEEGFARLRAMGLPQGGGN